MEIFFYGAEKDLYTFTLIMCNEWLETGYRTDSGDVALESVRITESRSLFRNFTSWCALVSSYQLHFIKFGTKGNI